MNVEWCRMEEHEGKHTTRVDQANRREEIERGQAGEKLPYWGHVCGLRLSNRRRWSLEQGAIERYVRYVEGQCSTLL